MAVTSPTYPRLLSLISPVKICPSDLSNGGGKLRRQLSRFKTCKTRKTLEKNDSVTGNVDMTAALELVVQTRRDIEKVQGDKKRMNIMKKWRVTGQKTMGRPRMNGAKVRKL